MIVLVTSDSAFGQRVVRAFDDDDVRVLIRDPRTTAPLDLRDDILFVLDCRQLDDAEAYLAQIRVKLTGKSRCIAVARLSNAHAIRVLTFWRREVADVIIPETDSVVDIIRAHVNDPTRSVASANALELLLRLSPRSTHQVLGTVLGSGFRVGTVKRLAARSDRDASGAGKALKRDSNWTQVELIDFAKATFAAFLIADSGLSSKDVAGAIGYAKEASLHALFKRVFAASVEAIRRHSSEGGTRLWLERAVVSVVAAHGSEGASDVVREKLGSSKLE